MQHRPGFPDHQQRHGRLLSGLLYPLLRVPAEVSATAEAPLKCGVQVCKHPGPHPGAALTQDEHFFTPKNFPAPSSEGAWISEGEEKIDLRYCDDIALPRKLPATLSEGMHGLG